MLIGLFAIAGCGSQEPNPASTDATEQKLDESLTFNDVTLDQVNEQGQKLWTVRSPVANYINEQKIVRVDLPEGELFQDGKLLYRISAKKGEVHQNGEKILLQEDIVATDPESGAVLRGQELEWLPDRDLLIVRNQLTGTHPQVDISANEGRVQTKVNHIELLGQVVATTKDSPVLQMRSDRLLWQINQQSILSDRPVEIDRYPCNSAKNCAPSDRLKGDRGEYNLQTKIAKVENNVQLNLSSPPLNVWGDSIAWSLTAQTVTADKPFKALHRDKNFTLTGDRGILDLGGELLTVTGNVKTVGNPQKPFNLQANQMVWDIQKEEIEGKGNVMYRQANPPLTVTGPQALGKLTDQTVAITGGNVVTEVVP